MRGKNLKHRLREILEKRKIEESKNGKGRKKLLCLTMIVKNESKNMPRLLDSLKPIIDMYSILDTGSTDDTVAVIERWGENNGIPGKVHEEEFINFAVSRTNSILRAKEAFPEASFFLLSDADFVWEIKPNFSKALLLDHKYLVEQHNPCMTYWNVRLLSSEVDWECVGVTHEYWAECKHQSKYHGQVRTVKMSGLAIDDREDGGCKQDKFTRDERLLREAIEDERTPSDLRTRYYFYLAQTLRDTNRPAESIEFYQKRIECGGWAEEVYYSKYQIARNTERLAAQETEEETKKSKFEEALALYLQAYDYRNTRAEALYCAVKLCRERSKFDEALRLAKIGRQIAFPSDTLFVEKHCYSFAFDFEITVVAYYAGEKVEGMRATVRLLEMEGVPEDVLENVRKNSRFYV